LIYFRRLRRFSAAGCRLVGATSSERLAGNSRRSFVHHWSSIAAPALSHSLPHPTPRPPRSSVRDTLGARLPSPSFTAGASCMGNISLPDRQTERERERDIERRRLQIETQSGSYCLQRAAAVHGTIIHVNPICLPEATFAKTPNYLLRFHFTFKHGSGQFVWMKHLQHQQLVKVK